MKTMLPPQQPLELVEVFDAYDGPRLFTARDADGRLFLALWIDEDAEQSVWFYLPISTGRLAALEGRELDLRTAFLNPEDGVVFRVLQSKTNGSRVSEFVEAKSIAHDDLPEPGEFLRCGPSSDGPPAS